MKVSALKENLAWLADDSDIITVAIHLPDNSILSHTITSISHMGGMCIINTETVFNPDGTMKKEA